jgi:membrane associated rhomboid family serine protease
MFENEHAKVPLSLAPEQGNLQGENKVELESDVERRKVIFSAIFAGALVSVLWVVHLYEFVFDWDTSILGLQPRTLHGLIGIFTEPLVHGDLNHLISNSVPMFLLLTALLYFYRGIGFRVLGWIWIITGVGVWIFARGNLHIGASGIVYGLAAFLAVSGMIRNDTRLMAISLLVVFLYGGMVWGVLPLFQHISWESHLMGTVAGIFCAIKYRHEGPIIRKYFEDEIGDVDEIPSDGIGESYVKPHGFPHGHSTLPHSGGIRYHYLPKQEDNESKS